MTAPTMTVGQLREQLADLDQDQPVLIADAGAGWFCYLDEVCPASEDDGRQLPTLYPGRPFDPRDL